MEKENTRIYKPELGIDGTIAELIDWSYHYDGDYSDEALDEICSAARSLGLPEEKCIIPLLVRKDRNRKEGLPYEQMKLDRLIYGKIGWSGEKYNGHIEIYDEDGLVLFSITGIDDAGSFAATGYTPVEEFMKGGPYNDDEYLEKWVGQVLFYSKVYQDQLEGSEKDS